MSKNQFRVGAEEKNARLDRMLQKFTGLSRKKVKGLLDQGRVQVNGRKVVIASWEMQPGDTVTITTEETAASASQHYLKIVHEDADLLVVDKDPGVPCEQSALATRPTMVSIVNAYLHRKFPHLKHHYLGLVHRLDRDTSGLMVYSKTREGNRIGEQFRRHSIRRRYLAVVEGRVESNTDTIKGFLKKTDLLRGGRKVTTATEASGRKAVTRYRVLERYESATLIEVQPDTGRTHQIRVQLASIGHPIVGDKIYGGERVDASSGRVRGFPRQALHACLLGFHHPVTGAKMEFSSELPRDMRRLVDRLRIRS